jgi:plasmid maintenance system antidote protein VapI
MTDRTGCAAARHGDEAAAINHRCTCADARADRNRKAKQRRLDRLHGPAHTDSTGTARRLQALASIGWSATDLADRIGVTDRAVRLWRGSTYATVTPRTAATIARLYEELQGTPGPSTTARTWAERSGWAAPLAWDDDAIDDVTARPVTGEPAATPRIDLDEVEFLESFGMSRHAVANQLGVRPESIERAEQRARTEPPAWTTLPDHHGDDHAMAH